MPKEPQGMALLDSIVPQPRLAELVDRFRNLQPDGFGYGSIWVGGGPFFDKDDGCT